jgi:hypothetical protein
MESDWPLTKAALAAHADELSLGDERRLKALLRARDAARGLGAAVTTFAVTGGLIALGWPMLSVGVATMLSATLALLMKEEAKLRDDAAFAEGVELEAARRARPLLGVHASSVGGTEHDAVVVADVRVHCLVRAVVERRERGRHGNSSSLSASIGRRMVPIVYISTPSLTRGEAPAGRAGP